MVPKQIHTSHGAGFLLPANLGQRRIAADHYKDTVDAGVCVLPYAVVCLLGKHLIALCFLVSDQRVIQLLECGASVLAKCCCSYCGSVLLRGRKPTKQEMQVVKNFWCPLARVLTQVQLTSGHKPISIYVWSPSGL